MLVYAEGGALIAFSAVVPTTKLVPPDTIPIKHSHIIWVGLDKRYRKLPEGPREERYAWRILDIIAARAATERPHLARAMSLFVHPQNEGAIRLYRAYGFTNVPEMTFPDKDTGIVYQGMAMRF